jgi:putative DNA methylase
MRALVFSALCQSSSEKSLDLLEALGTRLEPPPKAVEAAIKDLRGQYNGAPKVLDMFAGGGTIPFEAARLGAKAYSCDVNELSMFIQRCLLEYSQSFDDKELAPKIRKAGNHVLERVENESDKLYPLRKDDIFGYLWTYSMRCPNCGYRLYLSKRRWLSKKKDKNLAFVYEDEGSRQRASIDDLGDVSGRLDTSMGRSKAQCPNCNEKHDNISIQRCRDELIGLIRLDDPTGKEFLLAKEEATPSADTIRRMEESLLEDLEFGLPDSNLPEWSGVVNPSLYGMETHSDFLNPRQRVLLLLLTRSLRDEYKHLVEENTKEKAKCIVGLLSSLIDQVIDWNCRLSMWISQNEQVGRAFSGPGVAMLWDYAETDQLQDGPANLWSKLDRIVKGAQYIPHFEGNVNVSRAAAQDLPYKDGHFDAIVTDPPYYDNIYYSILSDFFYAWKRPLINLIEEGGHHSKTTDLSKELVASKQRSGSSEKAHEDYCNELTEALKEAERVLDSDGVFSFVYSHNSLLGWDAIVRAYRNTNLVITSAQPLSIERRQRPRAMTSEAKNTCVSFVSKIGSFQSEKVELSEVGSKLREDYFVFADSLIESGWEEDDAALAAYANAVGILANASEVKSCSTPDALRTIADYTEDRYPSFIISNRTSL